VQVGFVVRRVNTDLGHLTGPVGMKAVAESGDGHTLLLGVGLYRLGLLATAEDVHSIPPMFVDVVYQLQPRGGIQRIGPPIRVKDYREEVILLQGLLRERTNGSRKQRDHQTGLDGCEKHIPHQRLTPE